jgi:hypothetical protein
MNNSEKNIAVNAEKRDLIEKALQSTDNEKLDLFKSIVGGANGESTRCEPGVAYADSTYVKA